MNGRMQEMRWTKTLIATLRDNPQDAEIDSHKLLMRAGICRKNAAGLFTFMPLGSRTLKKIENIVRDEMDKAGALEILMPALQTADIWRKTGRWDAMGANMFRLKDRAEREMAMGPTAEEEVTELVTSIVSSYRQLPLIVYQIQTKFRDETRPRFGLMRSKEFIMKDAYSFDTDAEGADKSYWKMYKAYENIFKRCGLKATPVQADGGDMGDSLTHEFHALADAGEDGIAFCPKCGYAANLESARRKIQPCSSAAECPAVETVDTPRCRTIEEVASFFSLPASAFVKSLVYVADGKPVMACVPGDRDVNEVKLKRLAGAKSVALADSRTVEEVTGAPVGFAGPYRPASSVTIYIDESLKGARGMVAGANASDRHIKNLDLSRDVPNAVYADIAVCVAGDACPECGEAMELKRGIEVGQVFKLGTKYTEAFHTVYKTDDAAEKLCVMGCYGVGVTRTLQAVIEQSHDKDGIIWPASISPYQVVIDLLDVDDEAASSAAFNLEKELEAAGVDVLVDDRGERPGVKFKDADLIGFTVRVVVGAKGLAEGIVEVKRRDAPKSSTLKVAPEQAADAVRKALIG